MYKIHKFKKNNDKALDEFVDKYINIMNLYSKSIIFFDISQEMAYINDKIEKELEINEIEKFINKIDLEDIELKGVSQRLSLNGINISFSLKPIMEKSSIKFIICIIEEIDIPYKKSNLTREIDKEEFQVIGECKKIKELKSNIRKIAPNDSTVLLIGETGTGKELFAKMIHKYSNRSEKPFIVINCGAIPDTLVESELFGYEKGAFTGANSKGKEGKIELANNGTLFLDEIENMPMFMQNKLLRFLEDHKICRIGGYEERFVNVRIVSATNKDLKEMVYSGEFRRDLYYRLSVIPFSIPRLKDRDNDIALLSDFFVNHFALKMNKPIYELSPEVIRIFKNYEWEGNVRELRNTIEYAVNFEDTDAIRVESLPEGFRTIRGIKDDKEFKIQTLDEIEKDVIERALAFYGWDEEGKVKAANALGISRSSIYRKIAKYNLISDIRYERFVE